MSLNNPSVAIVGATGAVGTELIACLESREFPLRSLRLFASPRSAGRRLMFRGDGLPVEELKKGALAGSDIALFSAGSATSKQFAPEAVRHGGIVVDNSSAFRMDAGVPLVVPEVNAGAIASHRGIIANPNCVAIIAAVPLWPLHREVGIARVIAATYQAASGAGAAAMAELRTSTGAYLAGKEFAPTVLKHPYAFNLFSHDSAVDAETGVNGEETKVVQELRKIMQTPGLPIGITCVRVPVLRAHSIALTVELARAVTPAEARRILGAAPGILIVDDPAANHFPMPNEASGQGDVLVGRVRRDGSDPSGRTLAMFVAGDQLLKGAALNAVQIAEHLVN
ncbi:MAG TPA: aspartate-semialdehyde dehydrogenase [Acetobacteraceae bacterium]|jgi:aspartate-semialdehyde dehydrogenase|nr:aspartate-semialdehyde dehydrogenase [Acetobacteraceae bacterium]